MAAPGLLPMFRRYLDAALLLRMDPVAVVQSSIAVVQISVAVVQISVAVLVQSSNAVLVKSSLALG